MPGNQRQHLSRELFDFEGRTNIDKRAAELQGLHEHYVGHHPELQMVLHDCIQSLLFHKPDDALGFIQTHFKQLREKQNPVYHP